MGTRPYHRLLLGLLCTAVVALPLLAGCSNSEQATAKDDAKVEARKQEKLKSDK